MKKNRYKIICVVRHSLESGYHQLIVLDSMQEVESI